jgi:hypothetical protein
MQTIEQIERATDDSEDGTMARRRGEAGGGVKQRIKETT